MARITVLVLLLIISSALSAPSNRSIDPAADPSILGSRPQHITGLDDLPSSPSQYSLYGNPLSHLGRDFEYDVAVGSAEIIGETWYENQANGTIGKQIAIDPYGVIHVMWTKGFDSLCVERHMVYNFRLPDGGWGAAYDSNIVVDHQFRGGYGQVALLPLDVSEWVGWKAVGIYHSHPTPRRNRAESRMSVDVYPCLGDFSETNHISSYDSTLDLIWPRGTINRRLSAHILGCENPPDWNQKWMQLVYWRGIAQPFDSEYKFWDFTPPTEIGIASVISLMASSSVISNKVVLAWHQNRVGKPTAVWSSVMGAWQRNNDIRYVVLQEGEEYSPERHSINSITKILPPNLDLWGQEPNAKLNPLNPSDNDLPYGDIWRPYCDLDIEFDPWDDNLCCAFGAEALWERPFPNDDGTLIDGYTTEQNALWYWNSELDTITLIAMNYYYNRTDNSEGRTYKTRVGGWRGNGDRPSIAFDPDHPGHVYVTWVNFPKIQEIDPDSPDSVINWKYLPGAGDTSRTGYSNAEIMVSVSTDYGITWREPVDVTGTRWTGDIAPSPGQSRSESNQSVANLAEGALHIMYISDSDGGNSALREGSITNSYVVYQEIPLDCFDLDTLKQIQLPYEGFMFHNYAPCPHIAGIPARDPQSPTFDDDVTVTVDIRTGGEDFSIDSAIVQYAFVEQIDDSITNNDFDVHIAPLVSRFGKGDTITFTGVIPQTQATSVWYKIWARNSAGLTLTYPEDNKTYLSYSPAEVVGKYAGSNTIYNVQYLNKQWKGDISPYRGCQVYLGGIVYSPSAFNKNFGAYVLQEGVGKFQSILVRGISDSLTEGDAIYVRGVVKDHDPENDPKWRDMTYIDVSEYELESHGRPPAYTRQITVNQLTGKGGAEAYEGMLVQAKELTIADTLGYGREYALGYLPVVDDNSVRGRVGWICNLAMDSTAISDCGWWQLAVGRKIAQVTGVLTESFGHYAITPQAAADVGRVYVNNSGKLLPGSFRIESVYPNPFNGTTRVDFTLPSEGLVGATLYDLCGRTVFGLPRRPFAAGERSFDIDAIAIPTGLYILKLEFNHSTVARKLVVLK